MPEHSDFTFHHLETNEDVEQYLGIMRNVFGQNSNVDAMIKKWIDHHPAMTLNDFFVIKHQGKMIACLNIIPSEWSVGGIPLKVAELACVATLPEYRHQGLQRILMSKYDEQIAEQGYDLSAIEGIPYYYRQFGYEYALPLGESTKIQLAKIPDYKFAHVIRPFTSNDIARAMQLFTEAQKEFYVHSLRDEEIWKMQQETGMVSEYKFEAYAVEENGEMTAYFRLNANPESKELLLREITNVNEPTAQSILVFLKNLGIQRGLETLVATISHHEPFIECLVATGLAEQDPPYAWQIRIIDYAWVLMKMKPLFEKRLASSAYGHLTEKLNFNFYCYTVQVTIENGEIMDIERLETCEDRKIRFNPLVFVQLLLGYRSLKELQTVYPDFLVQPTYENLIDILFPKLPSYIHTNY
ncbi:MAG TPA: GNAT family N-acetyltransferase [Candidatus Acidoferrum sp.]|nr:GNAT family N-acetyltransferase [Candidatus Acidoferrum sp.]